MARKIEKVYSGDRLVKVKILPVMKKGIEKIEEKGEEVKEKTVKISGEKGGKAEEKKENVKEETAKVEGEAAEVKEKAVMSLDEAVTVFTKIPTITKEEARLLYNAGFRTLKDLASAPAESLLTMKDITLENVKNIKKELKDFYVEEAKRIEIVRKEKPAVEKSMVWVEDVTKKMFSVGKDTVKGSNILCLIRQAR